LPIAALPLFVVLDLYTRGLRHLPELMVEIVSVPAHMTSLATFPYMKAAVWGRQMRVSYETYRFSLYSLC
jgi:hypothetical protein